MGQIHHTHPHTSDQTPALPRLRVPETALLNSVHLFVQGFLKKLLSLRHHVSRRTKSAQGSSGRRPRRPWYLKKSGKSFAHERMQLMQNLWQKFWPRRVLRSPCSGRIEPVHSSLRQQHCRSTLVILYCRSTPGATQM